MTRFAQGFAAFAIGCGLMGLCIMVPALAAPSVVINNPMAVKPQPKDTIIILVGVPSQGTGPQPMCSTSDGYIVRCHMLPHGGR